MATKSFSGRGGTVSISTDGTAFIKIGQVKTVKFGQPKSNYTTTTNLDSPGNVDEFQPTTIDPGTLSLEGVANQQDPGQLLVSALFYAQTLIPVQVQYPPQQGMTKGLLRTFSAYVSSPGLGDLDVANASMFTTELKISSVITDTPGA